MLRLASRLVTALCLAAALAGISLAAAPAGLPIWAPGDPDPTIPFSDRYPAAILTATEADARAIVETGIDVETVRPVDGRWLVQANINDNDARALARFDRTIYKLRNLTLEARREAELRGERAWPTWAEYEADMQAIAAAHPNICRLITIGTSVQGRHIWFMKISDNPDAEEDEPEFKYTSSLHGDEVTGMELCRRLIRLLVDSYGIDPTLTSYVNDMEIWICPHSNPDGYVAVTRYNAHGVDLNRTFPDPITDPNDDPAGREPEVQHFMYFGYDHRFILSANYHGGALVVNYPWDCQAAYTPDDDMLREFSLGYAIRNPPMYNNPEFPNGVTVGWAWYIIHGGMQDWCYNWRSDMDVTIEVSNTKWPNWSLMDQFWNENRDAMLWYMSRSLVGVRGIVTDVQTGLPVDATVNILEIDKPIRTDPDIGDYQRMLLPGTYTLKVEAFGYLPQTISGIAVGSGAATRRDVQMVPLPSFQVSGTVTDEATGQPLEATVEARRYDTQELVQTTQSNPTTGSYAMTLQTYTYDLRVTADGHSPVVRRVILDQNRVENFQLPSNTNRILVVRDGATTRIADDLAALGFTTTVETASVTDPSSWSGYRLLVWSAGPNADPVADATKRAAIESFVGSGGRLLIEGGQIAYDVFRTPGYPSFGQNVLHCSQWDVSSAGTLSIASGAANHALVTTPNSLPSQYAINYTEVGDQDAVLPRAEATLIYKTATYPNDGGIIVYDDTPETPAIGQIVYYAFNYAKLTDLANAKKLLENSVTYLDRTNPAGVAEEAPAALAWLGRAYPNPARGLVQFRIEPSAGAVRAEVIDLQGRRLYETAFDAAASPVLTWDGRTMLGRPATTGIYFLRVSQRDAVARRAFLWLKP